MKATTTYNTPKAFSWSYSRLKNFETCPARHFAIDVAKLVKEEESGALQYGSEVHKALAARLGRGVPLPEPYKQFEDVAARIARVPGMLLAEQQYAITQDFQPCEWFARNTWCRAIADVIVVNPPVALAIDFKLGKVIDDSQQLAILAACALSHLPEVHAIRTEFWWLKDDAVTRTDIKRADLGSVWGGVMPRVAALQRAYETNEFPPTPGGLCRRYCPVNACKHHGGN